MNFEENQDNDVVFLRDNVFIKERTPRRCAREKINHYPRIITPTKKKDMPSFSSSDYVQSSMNSYSIVSK